MVLDGVASQGHAHPVKASNSGMKSLLVIVVALVVAVVSAYVMSAIEVSTEFGLYNFFIWFIIPAGAVVSGIVAASGYAGAAWLLNVKPGGVSKYMVPVVLALGVYFLVNFFNFLALFDGGITFVQYLELNITRSEYGIGSGSSNSGSATLGAFGYVLVLVQLAGFAVGGFVVSNFLDGKPYCVPCGRYLKKQRKVSRHSESPEQFEPLLRWAEAGLLSRDYEGVLSGLEGEKPTKKQKRNPKIDAEVFGCRKCQDLTVRLKGDVINGNNWKNVYQRAFPTDEVAIVDKLAGAAPGQTNQADGQQLAPPVVWQQAPASPPGAQMLTAPQQAAPVGQPQQVPPPQQQFAPPPPQSFRS